MPRGGEAVELVGDLEPLGVIHRHRPKRRDRWRLVDVELDDLVVVPRGRVPVGMGRQMRIRVVFGRVRAQPGGSLCSPPARGGGQITGTVQSGQTHSSILMSTCGVSGHIGDGLGEASGGDAHRRAELLHGQ